MSPMDAGLAAESTRAGIAFPASTAVMTAAGCAVIRPKVTATNGRQVAVFQMLSTPNVVE